MSKIKKFIIKNISFEKTSFTRDPPSHTEVALSSQNYGKGALHLWVMEEVISPVKAFLGDLPKKKVWVSPEKFAIKTIPFTEAKNSL